MNIPVTPFLRNVLFADAAMGGCAAILTIAGGSILAPMLALPASLLVWAGVALVPIVVLLLVAARRSTVSRMLLVDIIGINVLWVVASFAVLVSGLIEPNLLGIAFVVAQALAVALLAALQFSELRQMSVA